MTTKIAARKSNSQSQPKLSHEEVQRIAEKIAVALEHDEEEISLITMLFDHLEQISDNRTQLGLALYDIKRVLFVGTIASDDAQKQFQVRAYQNRGKLLQWPYEKKAKSTNPRKRQRGNRQA